MSETIKIGDTVTWRRDKSRIAPCRVLAFFDTDDGDAAAAIELPEPFDCEVRNVLVADLEAVPGGRAGE